MKAETKQLEEYARRMQDIVRRTAAIRQVKGIDAGVPWIVVTEIVYLQLRHILELLATALLTVNRGAVGEIGAQGVRSWHALDILRVIEQANPEFYPVPTKDGPRDEQGVTQIVDRKGDFLTREKFVTLYNCVRRDPAHAESICAQAGGAARNARRLRTAAQGRWTMGEPHYPAVDPPQVQGKGRRDSLHRLHCR